MSAGIADTGMRQSGRDRPTPLPVQALDHATGYMVATTVIRGLTERRRDGMGLVGHASLARTATLLASTHTQPHALASLTEDDIAPEIETTEWGPARRLRAPLRLGGIAMRWDRPAAPLGSSPAEWASSR
jgi:crotonobetainyl-CoA:carnitine CoA-transferase CaiB-like acyl-CoA transferase